jgi:hypothetical protein
MARGIGEFHPVLRARFPIRLIYNPYRIDLDNP